MAKEDECETETVVYMGGAKVSKSHVLVQIYNFGNWNAAATHPNAFRIR